jgi:hypothetical protein
MMVPMARLAVALQQLHPALLCRSAVRAHRTALLMKRSSWKVLLHLV